MGKSVNPLKVVPPKSRPTPLSVRTVRTVPVVRRVAVGALITAVVVGGTAGVTLAAGRDNSGSAPAVVRPSELTPTPLPNTNVNRVQDVAFSANSVVFTWPSASSTTSTVVRTAEPDQGVVRRAGTATRIAVLWAAAAALAGAGILAGTVLRRAQA